MIKQGPDGAPYLVWDTPEIIRAHSWRFENLVPEIDYLQAFMRLIAWKHLPKLDV
jgi:hypothetical protein